MRLSLATWNINSVRLRIGLVERFLAEHGPDVLCLQETKCRDAEFPVTAFHRAGYGYLAINGQKGYHGVAIASRVPFTRTERRGFCGANDARHLAATLALPGIDRAIVVHNLYVPAGGDEPDPAINPKFAHKLAFLDELTAWVGQEGIARSDAILVGDLNVAPLEQDVWSHKALLKVVSHTPVEVERVVRAQDAGAWVDVLRRHIPAEQKCYTWWSYRSPDWIKADKGRRLDHIWVSASLGTTLAGLTIFKECRGWDQPSDHVPVMATLDLGAAREDARPERLA